MPFSQELCEHLNQVETQSTSSGSRFLDACRHFNAGRITRDELIETTALIGFNNVIDAFHVVDRADVSTRFFVDERQQSLRGIRFTDELLLLPPRPAPGRRWRPRPNRGGGWLKAPGTSVDPRALRCASSTTGPA